MLGNMEKSTLLANRPIRVDRPRETAMGTFRNTRTKNVPNKIQAIIPDLLLRLL